MNARGITAVNGAFIPGTAVRTTPVVTERTARLRPVRALAKDATGLRALSGSLRVFRTGLLERVASDTTSSAHRSTTTSRT